MIEYDMEKVPEWVIVDGVFGMGCTLTLTDKANLAGLNGKLKLKIVASGTHGKLVNNCHVEMGAVRGNIRIVFFYSNANVVFEEQSSGVYELRLHRESKVRIGKGTTCNGMKIVCDWSEFITGNDCLFSDDILIQSADQHGIVDLITGEIVNNKKRSVILGNHVWLGRKCILMPDVEIGQGSIIGTGAVVTENIPEVSIAVGVPAKIVRKGMSWSRSPVHLDEASQKFIDRTLDTQSN